jgi:hypothetical protein
MKRCQFRPVGLICTEDMIWRILAASATVAGRRVYSGGDGGISIPLIFIHTHLFVKSLIYI